MRSALLALDHAARVGGLRLEAAVEVVVELLLAQLLAVGRVDEDGVDLPVVVPVLLLARAQAVLVGDEGVALPSPLVSASLFDLLVALEPGLEVDLAVPVGVLLLAHLLAAHELAAQVEAAVPFGVELLALALAAARERADHLGPAVAVLVAHLPALDAPLVGRLVSKLPLPSVSALRLAIARPRTR